jgi:hypothetical protein
MPENKKNIVRFPLNSYRVCNPADVVESQRLWQQWARAASRANRADYISDTVLDCGRRARSVPANTGGPRHKGDRAGEAILAYPTQVQLRLSPACARNM